MNDSSKYSQMFSHWILRLLLGWSARRYHGHRTWWVVLRPSCWKYLRPPCVSTFINKKRNFFLQEHWEQISFVTNFNILGFGQPFFSLLIADSLEKNDWTCPFVSHSSLERYWTTCVSGRSHVRCDLRKIWFPACLCINIKSCGEVRIKDLTFLLNLVPPPLNFCSRPSASLEFADTTRRFWKFLGWRQFLQSDPDTLSLFTGTSLFSLMCAASWIIGHTKIFSPCWAVLPKYAARCKVSSLSVIFSFV